MALDAYLTLTGDTQGEIQGSVTQAGREDSIRVHAVYHEVESPRDAASGLPTRKRQHHPITIVKPIDKSSPLLAHAFVNNENIPVWMLKFWRPSASGHEEQYYTIELTNANISSIRSEMLHNRYPENMVHTVQERVSFAYAHILWRFEEGGIFAEDDWDVPVV